MKELLIQFIVPLTFLAIWALTSILNRDGQPLPQRPPRPGDPKPDPSAEARRRREKARAEASRTWGPRDVPSSSEGSSIAPARPAAASGPAGRPPRPGGASPRPERPTASQPVPAGFDGAGVYVDRDEVVFLDPATGRQLMSAPVNGGPLPEGPKSSGPPRQRKAGRGRRAPADDAARASAEPETRRALSDQVGRAMEMRRNQPLEIQPLAPKLEGLTAPLSSEGLTAPLSKAISLRDEQPPRRESAPTPLFDAHAIQEMLAERPKLREIAVLSEILQPPVSLRRGRRL